MDLIELHNDRQFEPGDKVYHKQSGAIGTVVYCSEMSKRIEIDVMGITGFQITTKDKLTHKIPPFALPKHIYKFCHMYILALIYTWGVISLITVSALGGFWFSILSFISVMPITAGIVFEDVQKGYLRNMNMVLLYGVYETILFSICIYNHINKAA